MTLRGILNCKYLIIFFSILLFTGCNYGHHTGNGSSGTPGTPEELNTPAVDSFSPTSGKVGDTITITGTNFSTTPTDNTVSFNGTIAVVTSSTATQIVTTVPNGATTGPISVTVGGITAKSTINFTVQSEEAVVDQSNLLDSGYGWIAMSWSISQTFIPKMPILTGVDIDLVNANPNEGDTNITVKILDSEDQVLATATKTVVVGSADPGLVHFDFATDIPVTVGDTYTLSVPGTKDTFGLKYSGGNLYPYGFMTEGSTPYPDYDCLFQTYGKLGSSD